MADRIESAESSVLSTASRTRTIMMTLSYDGAPYHGWQVQPGKDTVQAQVEAALKRVTGEQIRVLCAGRTDSGVHALGQVVSFRTDCSVPSDRFAAAVTRHLPADIAVLSSQEVAEDFHATFSAVGKTYRYLLFDGPGFLPVLRSRVTRWRYPVSVEKMQAAARCLLGTHDFRCFESHFPNKATSVRTVTSAIVRREPLWSPWQTEFQNRTLVVFEFSADGFLYNMVRAVVGTLLLVGGGKQPPEFVDRVISGMDRGEAGPTAPPDGLYLVSADYPESLLTAPQR